MDIRTTIKALRESHGLSQDEFGKIAGVSGKAVSTWENGTRIPRMGAIQKLADFFRIKKSDIIGDTELPAPPPGFIALPESKPVPLLGTIACGTPIIAEENIEEYIRVDKSIPADFALRCKGDSMINARIFDGDIVFIRQQPDVESGEIAAVLIENEATLKRVIKYTNKLVLRPENPMYSDLVYSGEELADIRIIGKAVAFLSTVK